MWRGFFLSELNFGVGVDVVMLIKAAVMGIVEGLTEFLPISSTGHLILTGSLLGFTDDKSKVFDIAIQTGAIFAVILVYWQRIASTAQGLTSDAQARRFAFNVLIGFLPAAVFGLLLGKAVKAHLFTPVVVASTFILGGFIILWAESKKKDDSTVGSWGNAIAAKRKSLLERLVHPLSVIERERLLFVVVVLGILERLVQRRSIVSVDDMTPMDALRVGLVQCLAMIPGTSRSGATIIGGMLLGLSRQAATDFSFFLGIPTLIGAGAYSLWKERALLSMADLPLFSVGLFFSFVAAWLCVRWLLRYVATHNFVPFAWYRIAFGIVVLATSYSGLIIWKD
jgi:undecaprenyl-diphosphatase